MDDMRRGLEVSKEAEGDGLGPDKVLLNGGGSTFTPLLPSLGA